MGWPKFGGILRSSDFRVGKFNPSITRFGIDVCQIGYVGTKNSLLASGVYGVMKVLATAVFVFGFVESLGRKISFFISAMGMGGLFFIIGAILKTHPPPRLIKGQPLPPPPPASKAMAAMLYIYVCFYSMGWGPLPWVYVADIFPTRTRHYGLALASSSQWMWSGFSTSFFGTVLMESRFRCVQSDAHAYYQPRL